MVGTISIFRFCRWLNRLAGRWIIHLLEADAPVLSCWISKFEVICPRLDSSLNFPVWALNFKLCQIHSISLSHCIRVKSTCLSAPVKIIWSNRREGIIHLMAKALFDRLRNDFCCLWSQVVGNLSVEEGISGGHHLLVDWRCVHLPDILLPLDERNLSVDPLDH